MQNENFKKNCELRKFKNKVRLRISRNVDFETFLKCGLFEMIAAQQASHAGRLFRITDYCFVWCYMQMLWCFQNCTNLCLENIWRSFSQRSFFNFQGQEFLNIIKVYNLYYYYFQGSKCFLNFQSTFNVFDNIFVFAGLSANFPTSVWLNRHNAIYIRGCTIHIFPI